jgi:putative redox protein
MATVSLDSASGLVQHLRARTHEFGADEPLDNGGTDTGPNPYELLLGALVACTSLTARMYADRKGWDLGRIEVNGHFGRDIDGAEHIERHIRFGAKLSAEQAARLAEIMEKTPVTRTLKRSLPIATTYG